MVEVSAWCGVRKLLSAIVDSEDRRGLLYLSCHCSKISDKKGKKGARIYSDSHLREYSPSQLHRHGRRRAMKHLTHTQGSWGRKQDWGARSES